jgi:hypothetical protein
MIIDLKWITVREIVDGYVDNDIEGIRGFGGKLNIRPKYQREFVYDDKKQKLVINSIVNKFPLNVMYWVVNNEGGFEILDGQQRTVSFCRYYKGDYSTSVNNRMAYFHSLTRDEQEEILKYKIAVYFCTGTDKEIIDWFEIINIAGERLTPQELRNAVYTGDWLSDAKVKFSKPNCGAYLHSKDYVNGSPIRQEILETALAWITGIKNDDVIRDYMSLHQKDENAEVLWDYFKCVIDWVKEVFPETRSEMKGLDWGRLYKEYGTQFTQSNAADLEKEIVRLMSDDDVGGNKKGVYEYLLSGDEKHLNIRAFTENQKRTVYEQQKKLCLKCKKPFQIKQMEAHHIIPWSKGGKTVLENCQMLCLDCHRKQGYK